MSSAPSDPVTDSAESDKKDAKGGKKRKGFESNDEREENDDGGTKAASSKKGPAKKKGRQAASGGIKNKGKAVEHEGDEEVLQDNKVKGEEVEEGV